VTTPDYQKALGRKIAAERRRRGLSQPELARMVDRSVAWVSQVERGMRKVDRMSVLEALAAALEVPLAELAAEAPVVAAVTEEPPGAGGLRLVLSGAYALRAMLDGRRAPAVRTLRTKARKAWELTAQSGPRPRNRRPVGARETAGRSIRTAGHDLPSMFSGPGETRRTGSRVDRRRPGHGRRRTCW
jgi:transcriptional regulator with XRE-family HTH domain